MTTRVQQSHEERVHRYEVYDPATDEYVLSTRYAHNIQIAGIPGARAAAGFPSILVDRKYLECNWTKKGFDPDNPS